MATLFDMKDRAFIDKRPCIVELACKSGQREKAVDLSDCLRDLAHDGGVVCGFFAQCSEQFVLQSGDFFLGVEHFMLVLFKFGCDEPFSIDECLPSLEIVGDPVCLSAAHFDVIAECLGIADF